MPFDGQTYPDDPMGRRERAIALVGPKARWEFDIRMWSAATLHDPECGTVACWIGHMGLARFEGWRHRGPIGGGHPAWPKAGTGNPINDAAVFFGLRLDDAVALFGADEETTRALYGRLPVFVEARQVAAALRVAPLYDWTPELLAGLRRFYFPVSGLHAAVRLRAALDATAAPVAVGAAA
jgi:hypothetical protein